MLPDEVVVVEANAGSELDAETRHIFSGQPVVLKVYSTYAGTCHQRNLGTENSSGDIIIFLDDDVVLERDFVKEILRVFATDHDKKIGGVMGDITNIDRTERRLYEFFRRLFFLPHFGNGRFLPSGFPTFVHGEQKTRETEYLSAGLTAYRKEVLKEYRWDENLSGYSYMDDDDLSFRVSRKFRNIYTPYARVTHYPSPAGREDIRSVKRKLIQHHYYLFKKNFPQNIRHRAAFYLSIVGLALESIPQSFARKSLGPLLGILDGLIAVISRQSSPKSLVSVEKESPDS